MLPYAIRSKGKTLHAYCPRWTLYMGGTRSNRFMARLMDIAVGQLEEKWEALHREAERCET